MNESENNINEEILKLKERQQQLIQILEDFQHQIITPVLLVHERAIRALHGEQTLDQLRDQMSRIKGLSAKVRQVTLGINLFVNLSREQPIRLRLVLLEYNHLVKLLIEAAIDHELMTDPERRIRFRIQLPSFEILKSYKVAADIDLLDQSIRNLLDNASKYSYRNGVVRIYGGLTKTKRFFITIANEGIPIRASEMSKCVTRGWRGEHAKETTGEGSGLGLWIVDNIMKAHGGELVILPTVSRLTELKLVFPSFKE